MTGLGQKPFRNKHKRKTSKEFPKETFLAGTKIASPNTVAESKFSASPRGEGIRERYSWITQLRLLVCLSAVYMNPTGEG